MSIIINRPRSTRTFEDEGYASGRTPYQKPPPSTPVSSYTPSLPGKPSLSTPVYDAGPYTPSSTDMVSLQTYGFGGASPSSSSGLLGTIGGSGKPAAAYDRKATIGAGLGPRISAEEAALGASLSGILGSPGATQFSKPQARAGGQFAGFGFLNDPAYDDRAALAMRSLTSQGVDLSKLPAFKDVLAYYEGDYTKAIEDYAHQMGDRYAENVNNVIALWVPRGESSPTGNLAPSSLTPGQIGEQRDWMQDRIDSGQSLIDYQAWAAKNPGMAAKYGPNEFWAYQNKKNPYHNIRQQAIDYLEGQGINTFFYPGGFVSGNMVPGGYNPATQQGFGGGWGEGGQLGFQGIMGTAGDRTLEGFDPTVSPIQGPPAANIAGTAAGMVGRYPLDEGQLNLSGAPGFDVGAPGGGYPGQPGLGPGGGIDDATIDRIIEGTFEPSEFGGRAYGYQPSLGEATGYTPQITAPSPGELVENRMASALQSPYVQLLQKQARDEMEAGRGLGRGSSLTADAVARAGLLASLPIAQQDAQTLLQSRLEADRIANQALQFGASEANMMTGLNMAAANQAARDFAQWATQVSMDDAKNRLEIHLRELINQNAQYTTDQAFKESLNALMANLLTSGMSAGIFGDTGLASGYLDVLGQLFPDLNLSSTQGQQFEDEGVDDIV